MPDSEYPPWPAEHAPRVSRPRSPWLVLGIVLAVIACLAGLALLAVLIVFFTSGAMFGGNK
ncbi:MAG: hypothetical protein ABIQ09_15550 [Jatrophihabitantaceae bacterium]